MSDEEMSDEEALMKLAAAMKDNAPSQEDKHNVHTFLNKVVVSEDATRIGNLARDNELDELGKPEYSVRGLKNMALISAKICEDDFLANYFNTEAQDVLSSSLSDKGFLVKQATVQTKQIADVTKKRKINKGWFGSKKIEESGGDTTS